jgi:hypothetical protein
MERETGVPVLAVLPYDVNVLESLAKQTPYTEYKSKSNGAVEYAKLSSALLGERYNGNRFLRWLKRMMGIRPRDEEINRISVYYDSLFK